MEIKVHRFLCNKKIHTHNICFMYQSVVRWSSHQANFFGVYVTSVSHVIIYLTVTTEISENLMQVMFGAYDGWSNIFNMRFSIVMPKN